MVSGRVDVDIPVVAAAVCTVGVVELQPDSSLEAFGVLVTVVYRVALTTELIQRAVHPLLI